ncbi:amino acid adenylation domain-containing protein [Microlunatus sp. GCM10028923]|uniref:non-ribosomal peptide synthetase n=1 Tax=Microlunatus sp. GCM10028923 TaxID=3273400 RepID=UPI00361602B2
MPPQRKRFDGGRSELLGQLLAAEGLRPELGVPTARHDTGPAPLSFGQQRMWFLDQLRPGTSVYTIQVALRLGFAPNPVLLQGCVNDIVARHEVLRTAFRLAGDAPVAVVQPRVRIPLTIIDLSGLPPGRIEAAATGAATEQARQPFDLSAPPLLRTMLIKVGPADAVLSVSIHHAIADGWSMRVFFDELASRYAASVAGRPVELPALSLQYADYARWQRDQLADDRLAAELAHWTGRLAGLPTLELPPDLPRPAAQRFTGATRAFQLPRELTDPLRVQAARAGATPFMALLTGFAALLQRYTQQDDLVLGSPIAGRTRAEFEPMIGFFVNTLVLRLDLSGDPSFTDALLRVRDTCVDAYAHQDVPFERLVEALAPSRDLARNPLCQVAFQHFANDDRGAGPDQLQIDRGTSVFDCQLSTWDDHRDPDRPPAIAGRIEYNTDLYRPATIDRFLDHYQRLLGRAVERPELPLSRLELITDEGRERLSGWSRPEPWPADPPDLVQEILSRAAERPEAVAVLADDHRPWTYRDLIEASTRLAGVLSRHGVRPGGIVAVRAHRTPRLVGALLALLRLDATYLPLDPDTPPDRLADLLAEAAPTLLLSTGDLPEPVLPAGTTMLRLDRLDLDQQAPATLPGTGRPGDPIAYLIFTSGSTGRPKGVLTGRRALANRLRWMQQAYGLGPDDRVLHKTSIGFDVSLWELLWPLTAGATVVLAAPGRQADRDYLDDLIRRTMITTAHFVPSLLQDFLRGRDALDLPSLRRVICSGEALRPDLARRFLELSDAELHNLYGPTEAAIDVTAWTCRPGADRVPIGRPISGASCQVLDRHLAPTPPGIPGQLAIGGLGLAAGYLGRPDLTAERFISHPLGGPPDGRLYLTGDRARWADDGTLDYLGRLDDQVKVRGVRIELGEIDAVLAELTGAAAAADARPGPDGQPAIVAYLVPDHDHPLPRLAELRRRLAARLPDAFLPTALVPITELPLNRSGKLDRRLLPDLAPAPTGPPAEAGPEPAVPLGPAGIRILQLWQQILRSPELGPDDDFFDHGGHSLLATQLIARIRAELGVEIGLPDLFAAPTVTGLATLVERSAPAAAGDEPELVRRTHSRPSELLIGRAGGAGS